MHLTLSDTTAFELSAHRESPIFSVACAGGHAECVRLLLAAGCDTSLRNNAELTGWQLAETLRRQDVLTLRHQTLSDTLGDVGASQKDLVRTASKTELKQLKAALKAVGLSTKGSKVELRARLALQHDEGER